MQSGELGGGAGEHRLTVVAVVDHVLEQQSSQAAAGRAGSLAATIIAKVFM